MNQSNQISIDESFRKIICKDVQESTLREFLERLNQINYEETSTYLSGLVYLFTRKRWPQLGEYLLEKCAEHITFYEIIKCSYEAYNYKERQNAENIVAVFDQKIEEAKVNPISENQYEEKESRSNYVNSIHRFVTCLTILSLHLKNVPLSERQRYLRRNLIKGNRALESFCLNNPVIKYCKGIILPLKGRSQMVVRIIDTEAQSFNTKKRLKLQIWMSMNETNYQLLVFKNNYQQIHRLFQNLMLCINLIIQYLKISYKKIKISQQGNKLSIKIKREI